MANPILVEVTRGPPVESIHRGAMASLPIALGERRVPDGLYAQQQRP